MKPYYHRAGWRWLPGMLAKDGDGVRWRVYAIARHTGYPLAVREGDERVRPECGALVHDAVPVLDDPATQGAALAVLREARGCRLSVHVMPHAATVEWAREPQHSGSGLATYSTTANTLAAALLAALDRLIPE